MSGTEVLRAADTALLQDATDSMPAVAGHEGQGGRVWVSTEGDLASLMDLGDRATTATTAT